MSDYIKVSAAACNSLNCAPSMSTDGAHMHAHSARAILRTLLDGREMDSDEHTEAYDLVISAFERALGLPHSRALADLEASVKVVR